MKNQQQRKKKLKSNKRKRLLRYLTLLVIGLSIVFIFAFLIATAISSGMFVVKHITVEGNEMFDTDTIVEYSGIAEGENIFGVDLNKAHYNLESKIHTDAVDIVKVLPDTVVIKITEEPVIAAIECDKMYNYINNEKELVEKTEYLRKTNVPLISGFAEIKMNAIGQKIEVAPDWKFDIAMKVLALLESDGQLSKISEIILNKDNTYSIITKNNVVLIVKNDENFTQYRDYINTVLEQNKSNLEINMTSGNNPIMKKR